jgi:hypothetical protein
MVAIRFAEDFYSFRSYSPVFGGLTAPPAPSEAALAAIDAKLVEASNLFYARKYSAAIDAYNLAAQLIWAQIRPAFQGGIVDIGALSFDQRLFDPMLSLGAEWLNVLPPHEPDPVPRPRLAVPNEALGKAAELERLGLTSALLHDDQSVSAAADLQLANALRGEGNTKAAIFFDTRARASDDHLVQMFAETPVPEAVLPQPSAIGRTVGGLTDVAIADRPAVIGARVAEAGVARSALTDPIAMGDRVLGVRTAAGVTQIQWKGGDGPPLDEIKLAVYAPRVTASLAELARGPRLPEDAALALPHDYYYVIPLGLAECYHALGSWQAAEENYLRAASYQYLNTAIEAPYLWLRLATLYVDWGDALFRADKPNDALALYTRVVGAQRDVPASALYTTVSLKPGADAAKAVIAKLPGAPPPEVNPLLAAAIFAAWQQISKIAAGLDWLGISRTQVPIWTFDYLQSVAVNFAQLAIGAERDWMNYLDRADQSRLTRQQIVSTVAQAQAEAYAMQLQADAANAEAKAFADGVTLAQKRATDAQTNSASWIVFQAISTQLSGGDNGDWGQLNGLADQLLQGQDLHGSRATLAASSQLASSKLNRQYEVDSLNRQAAEMNLALVQANSERTAAQARANAARAGAMASSLRAQGAADVLQSFDAQTFTPDVWARLADAMSGLYQRYLAMALRVAKLMQIAYNFETDQSLSLIRSDYSSDAVNGFLGAEQLLADVQSFTYDLITSSTGKPQPLKQTLSLAQRYGFAFETQLRRTGSMQFDTRIDDFDDVYPGTYGGRIESVEVEIAGIVPPTGISGTLTNEGISAYRVPSALWTGAGSGLKYRVQPRETLVLSDYGARVDALLVTPDSRMLRVFQGAGLASTWTLELPKAINDLDYGALTDVRVTFYYKARFDRDLKPRVLAQLATRPGLRSKEIGLPMRWLFPDAFFRFQDTGRLAISLHGADFPRNEYNPMLTNVGLLFTLAGAPRAIAATFSTPGKAAVNVNSDATGAVDASAPAVAPLSGATAVGDYTIEVAGTAADRASIVNVALILGYSYSARP